MPHFLLKFQIGPVQDFIAQARSTRDLWSGSYLLSWLVAAGIRKLKQQGSLLIFPYDSEKCQPLLELPDSARAADHKGLLTPNLPNIFIAKISTEKPGKLASEVKAAIAQEWQDIAQAVWNQRQDFGLPTTSQERFFAQIHRHLAISWQITPLTDDSPSTYRTAYQHNGWHLDAVRQTRDFHAWNSAVESENERLMTEKDSLSGKEEALVGGKDFKEARAKQGGEYANLFKHADYLGATAIIKRVWHIAYLRDLQKIKAGPGQNHIRSIPAIAARTTTLDDDEEAQEKTPGDKYIAAIAFDGDSIGAWVNGDRSPEGINLEKHHSNFSRFLSNFALGEVRKIVERQVDGWDKEKKPIKVPLGQLIYAGGDDVIATISTTNSSARFPAVRSCSAKTRSKSPKWRPCGSCSTARPAG